MQIANHSSTLFNYTEHIFNIIYTDVIAAFLLLSPAAIAWYRFLKSGMYTGRL